MKKRVLFVCRKNSSLSQMAAGLLDQLCGACFETHSASFEPRKPSRLILRVMSESGVDISHKETTAVSDLVKSGGRFDFIITLSDEIRAKRDLVLPASKTRLHWGVRDPSDIHGSDDLKMARTRDIRDALRATVEAWCGRVCPNSAAHEISFKPFYSQRLNTPVD